MKHTEKHIKITGGHDCNCKVLFCNGCEGKRFELHIRKNSEMVEVVCRDCNARLMKFPDTSIEDFNNLIIL